jgi:hypothetical protein
MDDILRPLGVEKGFNFALTAQIDRFSVGGEVVFEAVGAQPSANGASD